MPVDLMERKNHRAAVRMSFNPEILCLVIDQEKKEQWPAWVRDVSASGICLLIEPKFEPGAKLSLEIRTRDCTLERRMIVEVKHSAICFPNNTWLHGCAFAELLSDADVARLAWR